MPKENNIKLPQGSDYHGNGKLFSKKNTTNKLTLKIKMLERELKDAWERNEVQNKYWHNIATERNTLQKRVEELETELYFCRRNNKIEELIVDK
jgi:alkylhydroperoxidase/carboxymuconolactone decarboxylase family protein YurZ